MPSLEEILGNSSTSLGSPSEAPAVESGESGPSDVSQSRDRATFIGTRVPGDDSQEGLPSEVALPADRADSIPEGVIEVTPAGFEIYYQWAPKRLYRLRPPDGHELYGSPVVEWLVENWIEVESVTTHFENIGKPGLKWWGMVTGVEGVFELLERGVLRWGAHDELVDSAGGVVATEDVVRFLTQEKLTVNHVRDRAADRGTNVHTALEQWAAGIRPQPKVFPESEQGYVRGILKFIDDVAEHGTPLQAEVMVGSLNYLYAGRYDLRLALGGVKLCSRVTKTGRETYTERKPGVYLVDLKTSKGVYEDYHMQVEAYEQASIESGYDPTDERAVLRVTPEGQYEFVTSKATLEDFLVTQKYHQMFEDLKRRKS